MDGNILTPNVKVYRRSPFNVCCRYMTVSVAEDGTIADIRFVGGCKGNLAAITNLIKGKKPAEVIPYLKGIHCGNKDTSCADQLAILLETI